MEITDNQLSKIYKLGYRLMKKEDHYLKFTGNCYLYGGRNGKKSVAIYFDDNKFYYSNSWISYKYSIDTQPIILALQIHLNKVKEDERAIKEILENVE